jgi:hypothetical protein
MVKIKRIRTPLVSISVIAVVGIVLLHTAFGATGTGLTMQSSQTTYTDGGTIAVQLYENSGSTTGVAGADVFVDFSTSQLTYAGVDSNGAFTSAEPTPTVSGGSVEIARVSTTSGGLTGSQLIETVNFTVASNVSGTIALSYGSSSQVNSATDGSNTVSSTSGVSFTLATTTTPPVTTTPTPPATTTPTPTPTPAASSSTKGTSVKISASPAATPVTVSNGGTAQVSQPVEVQPVTSSGTVTKVEYFLDGRLVDTETKAPYTYHLDTNLLTDGSHTLVTQTDYANGTNKSTTQHLLVTDGIKKSSISFVWIVPPLIIVLIALAVLLYTHFIHFGLRRFDQGPTPAAAGAAGPVVSGALPTEAEHGSTLESLLSNIHTKETPPPSSVVKPEPPPDQHDSQV